MRSKASIQGDRLANALRSLGVNFVSADQDMPETIHNHPARLIRALTQSKEARLRLSLIPLFLDHPEFSRFLPKVTRTLLPTERLVLQCYYTAALFFQKKFSSQVEILHELPDLFSVDLGLEPSPDIDVQLESLAARHKVLSQTSVNWLGTYQHAAEIWLRAKTYKTNNNGSFSIS
jgi:hypothetical protein